VRGSVTIHMSAPPERIFELVSDVTKIGRYSPETFEAEWLDGATGPAVGVRFRGHVKRNQKGPTYWATCVITECEPNRAFGFTVGSSVEKGLNNWRYGLEASGTGTDVTESFRLKDVLPMKVYWALLGWARGKTNRDGMRTTLERMKAELESGQP
jgi:uncharacterized protein YndB with AHSA1/START domain